MDVTFTKGPGRRYFMTVVRERGVELAPRQGPGYHEYLPHDAVHLLVEAEAGLTGGVFGRIAAGHSNIFSAADPRLQRRVARREARHRPQQAERIDMAHSEGLASVCLPLWELREGHRSDLPVWISRVEPDVLGSPLLERILIRMGEFAARWHALPAGGSITVRWEPRSTPTRRNTRSPGFSRRAASREGLHAFGARGRRR